ncbi:MULTISPECIES: YciI family protein [Pseudomonas]|jgi:uncharacterized protein YciI|uniref:YCII-related domain-containing protein n=1 Tax=Pseudomonas oryzihabitans TaxID=47885 RepID=A0A178LAL2_9PSED|nr:MULTISPECIES: YciI family protein [Pseudomonas]MBA1183214.1 hypothetical protein [Pseudomonas psychrotolerans]MBA1214429.1 hypothetical protein [Pseudomonas psychrotolerans]MDC7832256.1 YciI family protein [Pseudomonas benzopyrenica]NRH44963.1 hypothetical protein [Pseudomonas sp. MS15a(2019)]OAN26186.1 hypothetical protein A4V15_23420 [Pseudomonas oryzihabitans]
MIYAINLTYTSTSEAINACLDAHKEWLIHHLSAERILFAGPLEDKAGGFILAFGSSLSEIEQMLAADPFVAHGLVRTDILATQPALRAANFSGVWAAAAKPISPGSA